jgi:transcriptional regulator with XRE-family HTH domain
MTEIQRVLAQNLRLLRKRLGYSQALLAEQVNCAPNYISQIEQGKKFPSPVMIEKLANALFVESWELFGKRQDDDQEKANIELELIANISTSIHNAFERLETVKFEKP